MIKNEPNDIKQIKDKFYGIYRGVVEEDNPLNANNDELKDGRIKVRVWGLHTKDKSDSVIPTINLPLAQPAYPNMIGSITGKGMWSVPTQGTHVFLFFENGDHMQPRYFATAPGIEPPSSEKPKSSEGFADPDDVYPLSDLMDQPDMNRLMRGISDGTCISVREENIIGDYELPSQFAAEYPYNTVFETRGDGAGEENVIEMDATPGAQRINIWQADKSYIEMGPEGRFDMRSGKDKYDIIGKDRWLWVEEEDNMHVEKTKTDEVKEEWTMESLESTILIKAAVSITLEAPIIYLNGQVIYSGGGGGSDVPDTYNTHTHPPDTASPPDPQM